MNVALLSAAAIETTGDSSYVWLLLEMLLVLAVVVVVGWLAVRALSRRAGGRGVPVRVLSRQMLEARTSLYVLGAGERVLLVGSSPAGLRTLAELDAGDLEAMGLSAEPAPPDEAPRSFRDILAERLGKRGS